jgi:hypothetical protein
MEKIAQENLRKPLYGNWISIDDPELSVVGYGEYRMDFERDGTFYDTAGNQTDVYQNFELIPDASAASNEFTLRAWGNPGISTRHLIIKSNGDIQCGDVVFSRE